MKHSRRMYLKLVVSTILAATFAAPAFADEAPETAAEPQVHEVLMYNADPNDKKKKMVFVPDLLRANPGDTIRFVSSDKSHNAVSDKLMLPEGADAFKSKISKDFEYVVTAEGTYGYFCQPHRNMGMVGLILVGDPSSNYEDAKAAIAKQKGKAKKVYKDIFERADAMLAAEQGS